MQEKQNTFASSRRDFLKGLGCLTITVPLFTTCWISESEQMLEDTLPGSLKGQPNINAWLEILETGNIRVFTGKMELGQGIRTAIAQVAAEELDLNMEQVEVHLAETGRTPHEGYTAGSGSIENSAMSIRYACAFARHKLLELAAPKLNAKVDGLDMANGIVWVKGKKNKLTFAQILNGAHIEGEVKLPVKLKDKSAYKLVGKAIARKDIERMVKGEPVYIQDLRFDGMVHARVVRPRAYKAHLLSFDEAGLRSNFADLLKIVRNGDFLGIIASDEYEVIQAHSFLKQHSKWSQVKSLPAAEDLQEYIKNLPATSEQVKKKGDVSSKNTSLLKASYFKPYIMHASIGPSCAVALYEKDMLHIWSHSQGIYPLREALTSMLGMDKEKIHIVGVPASGCYGHNGADDAAADAALLAIAYPGKHVRVQWSRADEHGWEPFGSAIAIDLEASLDSLGRIHSWHARVWTDSHSTRPGSDPATLLAARHIEEPFTMRSAGYTGGGHRNAEPYYAIANLKIDAHYFEGPLRVSSLRGLGAYANIFALESFMDELAQKAGKDPLDFRLAHLQDERAIEVLKKIQELTKSERLGNNQGMGFAFSRYKNTAAYCAVAARVLVSPESGETKIEKLWACIDAGEVINLDGLINQTEGGLIQSASWTLKERVVFDSTHVTSLDWGSYPIFRFSDIPEVQVVVIERPQEKALGAGEAAQGPTSAAIANAVYQACGKRIRHLPILPEKIKG